VRTFPLFIAVALILAAFSARGGTCSTVPDGDGGARFSRPHKVPHVDGGMRTIKRQDGSTIEVPALVTVTDELVVWAQESSGLCMSLTTYAQNGHQCEVQGPAKATGRGQYLFSDTNCSIRLVQVDRDRVRLDPMGPDCKSNYCGMLGVIERATYVRR
jgi:hypothetical protein